MKSSIGIAMLLTVAVFFTGVSAELGAAKFRIEPHIHVGNSHPARPMRPVRHYHRPHMIEVDRYYDPYMGIEYVHNYYPYEDYYEVVEIPRHRPHHIRRKSSVNFSFNFR